MSTMEIESEQLILLVQKHSCLYDPKCPDYRVRSHKIEAWTNICRKLMGDAWEGKTSDEQFRFSKEVQKRWKSLKDAYCRSRRYREEKRENGIGAGRPYIYEKQMTFILPIIQSRQTSRSKTEKEDVDEKDKEIFIYETVKLEDISLPSLSDSEEDSKQYENVATEEAPLPIITSTSGAVTDQLSGSSKRKNASSETYHLDPLKIQRISTNSVSRQDSPVTQHEVSYHSDEDKMFLLSLLPYMKNMSPVDKLDFKISVMQSIKSSVCKKK